MASTRIPPLSTPAGFHVHTTPSRRSSPSKVPSMLTGETRRRAGDRRSSGTAAQSARPESRSVPELPSMVAALRPPTRVVDFDVKQLARRAAGHTMPPIEGLALTGTQYEQPLPLWQPARQAMNMSRTDKFLVGVTLDAQEWNTLHARALRSRGASQTQRRSRTLSDHFSNEDQSEEQFVRTTDQLVARIGELKRWHDAYEGKPGDVGMITHGKKQSDTSEDKEAELERRRERFELYKLVKKIEPELPPLQASEDWQPIKRDQTLVRRNATSQSVLAARPEAVEQRRGDLKAQGKQRAIQVQTRRELELDRLQKVWREDLARKRLQGKMASAARGDQQRGKSDMSQNGDERTDAESAAALWLTLAAITSFMNTITADPTSIKMTSSSSPLQVNLGPLQLSRLNKLMPGASMSMSLLAHRFKCKLQVGRRRKAARLICDVLSEWRTGGRFFVSLIYFMNKIKLVQHWWRKCRARLKEVRDRLSKRWIKLERAEIAKELNVASPTASPQGQAAQPSRRFSSNLKHKDSISGVVSLEDRISLRMVDESTRQRFLEHELRVRRHLLLPAILIWELEDQKWRQEVGEWERNVEATKALAINPAKLQFRWPPVRPSYLPMEHPATEMEGTTRCTLSCCGRAGDLEILDMIRLARDDPSGKKWRQVEKSRFVGGSVSRRTSVQQGSPKKKQEEEAQQAARPFGEAGDEELLEWGLDPDRMPGLAPSAGPQQAPEDRPL